MATKGPKTTAKSPVKAAPKPAPVATKPVVAEAKAPVAPAPKPVVPTPTPEPVAAKPVEAAPVAVAPAKVEKKLDTTPAPIVPPAPVVEAAVEAVIETPVTEAVKAAPAVAAKTAQTVQKDIVKMATTFEAPKFETPKAFTEMNDRAKAAFEKSGKFVEEMNEFAKGNVEALVESGKITAKGFETLGQDAAEYSRKSFEGFTATLKNLAAVKSPADFFKLQSDYVRSSFDSAVAETSKGTEAFIKLASDASQPISNRFALAAEKVKAVA